MRTVGISNYAAERFAGFVDLDVKVGPQGLRRALSVVLAEYGVPFAWCLETSRGYHVVAPFCFTFRDVLGFHRALDAVGADDTHRRVSITNGRFILRVTGKPDSGPPKYRGAIHALGNVRTDRRSVLKPIYDFYVHQMGCTPIQVPNPAHGEGETVRLEGYDPLPKEALVQ